MNRKPFRRMIATVALAAAATVGTFAASATEASAWSYQPIAGSRGNVSMPTVYVGDLVMPSGYRQFTLYSNTGPIAYRSAASTGAQTVKARYRVEQYFTTGWAVVTTSPLLTGQIGAGQTGVQFTPAYLQPTSARGYFRITWAFDWFAANGASLGSTYIVPGAASDHVCVTPVRLCQAVLGYVQTGLDRYTW